MVQIQGLYLDNDRGASVVDDFIGKLEQSELYTVDKGQREVPNETEWAHGYSLGLILKDPIPLGTALGTSTRRK